MSAFLLRFGASSQDLRAKLTSLPHKMTKRKEHSICRALFLYLSLTD